MIISDFDYLEDASQGLDVVGGRSLQLTKNLRSAASTNLSFNSNTSITESLNKNSTINATSNVLGNLASIAFDNEAQGPNSVTQATFSQLTIQGVGSSQSGTLISSTNG